MKEPTAVCFSPLLSDDIRNMSVLQVRKADDLRSSKLGGERSCGTCGKSSLECVGHFGHIELPVEVPHPLFSDKCLSVIAVPPTRMRLPNADHDAPLTSLLHKIIRCVDRFKRSSKGTDKARASAADALKRAVVAYFTVCPSSGAAGLCARMRGKQGTLRQTLMGWRVNSCARAVVAPDPCLAPWEVGVPATVANDLKLKEGCSVLLNRQPSLHRGAIMGHVVRIRQNDSCFSISPTVTPPYNADFDGDEMNLHVCSVESAADARVLIGVENCILSSASGNAIVRPVQDACLSWWLRSGLSASEQKAIIVKSCETEGSAGAAKRMHAEQLAAFDHISRRGFSVGVDDFLDVIPVTSAGPYTLGEVAASATKHVRATNRIAQMVAAGSKGSTINLAQLFGCVGFQTVQGKPAIHPSGKSAFIKNSFVQGMTPDEFWMHASAAREGMIQTAVKTADTGYLMRRMVKSFENISVSYDGLVRSASGQVVQFRFGEDGKDPSTARFQIMRDIEPGEAVGVVCAQSIGERLTQLTLDTFHKAGVAFKHGIHRVKSLLDAGTKTLGMWRCVEMPYRLARYDIDDVVQTWSTVDALPARALLEMRMRGMTRVPLCRATICHTWLQNHGFKVWQVAARIRETSPCVSDGKFIYSEKPVGGASGAAWAGDVIDNDSISLVSDPPLSATSFHSEPISVAATLGIEAAAAVLKKELMPYVHGVDYRHVSLLSDAMTFTGEVLGTTRGGMRRADEYSVLGRACFETGPQILAQAAVERCFDPLYSASSRMAIGMVPRLGAHACEVKTQSLQAKHKAPCSFLDQPPVKRGRFGDFMKH